MSFSRESNPDAKQFQRKRSIPCKFSQNQGGRRRPGVSAPGRQADAA